MSWECEKASISMSMEGALFMNMTEFSSRKGNFLELSWKNDNYSLSFVIISSPEKAIKTAEDDMYER